jgi:hypothetical protein
MLSAPQPCGGYPDHRLLQSGWSGADYRPLGLMRATATEAEAGASAMLGAAEL